VIPPQAAEDAGLAQTIADAVGCGFGVPDRSGLIGIDQPRLEAFFAELSAYQQWAHGGDPSPDAAAGFEAVRAVKVKVDDWFNRCRLAEYDPKLAAPEPPPTAELQMLPLARVEPHGALPLLERVNPAWSGALATFH